MVLSEEEKRRQKTEYKRRWREKNHDKDRAASLRYYHSHTDVVAARKKAYRSKNGEKIRAREREEYRKNRESELAAKKLRYLENRAEIRKKQAEYYRAHRDRILQKRREHRARSGPPSNERKLKQKAYQQRRRAEHHARIRRREIELEEQHRASGKRRVWKQKYRQNNREKLNAYLTARRRCLRDVSKADLAAIAAFERLVRRDKQVRTCYWCGRKITRESPELDHIVPLAKGGRHHINNICLSCRRCNRSKGSKAPEAFAKQLLLL